MRLKFHNSDTLVTMYSELDELEKNEYISTSDMKEINEHKIEITTELKLRGHVLTYDPETKTYFVD